MCTELKSNNKIKYNNKINRIKRGNDLQGGDILHKIIIIIRGEENFMFSEPCTVI